VVFVVRLLGGRTDLVHDGAVERGDVVVRGAGDGQVHAAAHVLDVERAAGGQAAFERHAAVHALEASVREAGGADDLEGAVHGAGFQVGTGIGHVHRPVRRLDVLARAAAAHAHAAVHR